LIGGTSDELAMLALAVDALVEKLEVCQRRRPPILDDIRAQAKDWSRLDATSLPCNGFSGEGEPMVPMLLTKKEVAALLRLSERQVDRVVAEGRLRAVHEGRAVRFRHSDLAVYVESLAAPATTEVEVR
jgi:excisionase family DNA binding protein